MSTGETAQIAEKLEVLMTFVDSPEARNAIQGLCDTITAGNITHSKGIAIGRNIRQVINQVTLPPESIVALLELRHLVGQSVNLDPDRYQLSTYIAEKAKDFVRREYVFEAIDEFLLSNPGGYLIIEADPGMGKSATLAEYVRRTGCIAHLNVRSLGIVKTSQFLESVCTQLIVDFGLPYVSLPPNATQDGAFLSQLLEEASTKLQPEERLIIAVDALDEVDLTGHPEGANILFLPTILPKGVYFVLTCRQVDIPFVAQAPQTVLDLMKHPAKNRSDAEGYLKHAAERPRLGTWIERQDLSIDSFVATLADLSESNFMYLHYVLPEIEKGTYQNLALEELPAGLKGYYEDHWKRMGMMAKPLPRVKIRIVYILSEVQQPVSRRLITQFADGSDIEVDELVVQEVLDEWDPFLHEQSHPEGTRYSLYHASFRDFLHRKDIVQAAGVTIEGIHALIADDLWEDLFGPG